MNSTKLRKIILEELSLGGSGRPYRLSRKLGLVDYLGESSDRYLLALDDDSIISTGARIHEASEADGDSNGSNDGNLPTKEDNLENNSGALRDFSADIEVPEPGNPALRARLPHAAVGDGAPVAAPKPVVAREEADARPKVTANEVIPTPAPLSNGDSGDSGDSGKPENDNLERDLPHEDGSEENARGPGAGTNNNPSAPVSLSDMIDGKIDAAEAEAKAKAVTGAASVAEGAYWRRGLVDLLYSN